MENQNTPSAETVSQADLDRAAALAISAAESIPLRVAEQVAAEAKHESTDAQDNRTQQITEPARASISVSYGVGQTGNPVTLLAPGQPTRIADHAFSSVPSPFDPEAQNCNVAGCIFSEAGHPDSDVAANVPASDSRKPWHTPEPFPYSSGEDLLAEVINKSGLAVRISALEKELAEMKRAMRYHGIRGPSSGPE